MNFLEKALNFIFPPVCGICGKIGEKYLCEKCKKELITSNMFLNQLDIYSKENLNYINEHFYLFSYEGTIREIILKYKFEDQAYLSNTISEFFINNEKLYGFFKKYDIIGAVPISKARKRERGYNQSELVVRKISELGLIHFEPHILEKVKNNKPQSSLNKKQRVENVKNVYKIQNRQRINEKKVLLFDDIYTTGATANECAKVLKQAGSKNVGIITIARD